MRQFLYLVMLVWLEQIYSLFSFLFYQYYICVFKVKMRQKEKESFGVTLLTTLLLASLLYFLKEHFQKSYSNFTNNKIKFLISSLIPFLKKHKQ